MSKYIYLVLISTILFGQAKCLRAEHLRYSITGQANLNKKLLSRLAHRSKKSTHNYLSPSGRFHFFYESSGPDAISMIDTDLNLIPDYVDKALEALENSYTIYVLNDGFRNPFSSFNLVEVHFMNMNDYGSVSANGNEMFLDNDYVGFPSNDDPEGDSLGALKVTIAHEFKHVIQFVTDQALFLNFDVNWVELDATWGEEHIYPQINDFYNYLSNSASQIQNPLFTFVSSANSGSYEHSIWQNYLESKFSIEFLVDLWERRSYKFKEDFFYSYQVLLYQYGSSIEEAISEYVLWNFLTKDRYTSIGYQDAINFPISSTVTQIQAALNEELKGNLGVTASKHYLISGSENAYLHLSSTANETSAIIVSLRPDSILELQHSSKNRRISTQKHLADYLWTGVIILNNDVNSQFLNFDYQLSLESEKLEPTVKNNGPKRISLGSQIVRNKLSLILNEFDDQSINITIRIYNSIGQTIKTSVINTANKAEFIDISNLVSGMYFLQIDSSDNFETLRFVKYR